MLQVWDNGSGLLLGETSKLTSLAHSSLRVESPASPVPPVNSTTADRTASGYATNAAAQSHRSSRRENNVVNEGARIGHANVLSWLQGTSDDPSQVPDAGEAAPSTVRMDMIHPF